MGNTLQVNEKRRDSRTKSRLVGRRRADSNRWCSFCRAVPYHLATSPCRVLSNKGSGRRGSNPRLSPWQGDALPLSHSRVLWKQASTRRNKISYRLIFVNIVFSRDFSIPH